MWCNQIFSLLSPTEGQATYKIENQIVADNYEVACKIARAQYGQTAIAVETTQYPVIIGHTYCNGFFYDASGTEVPRNETEAERIAKLEAENHVLKVKQEENDAELLYQICLLQLGITEEEM